MGKTCLVDDAPPETTPITQKSQPCHACLAMGIVVACTPVPLGAFHTIYRTARLRGP